MKIVTKPEGSYSGVHTCNSSLFLNAVSINKKGSDGNPLTNIYVGYGGDNGFNIWIDGCPKLKSDQEILNVLNELGQLTECIEHIGIYNFEMGVKSGEYNFKNKLKDLLDIR